jgi:hypothetical protein
VSNSQLEILLRLVAALAPAQRAGATAYAAISPRGILQAESRRPVFNRAVRISGDAPPT